MILKSLDFNRRNAFGALAGGILGMLAFGLAGYPWLGLIGGVMIGCAIGHEPDKIWGHTRSSVISGMQLFKEPQVLWAHFIEHLKMHPVRAALILRNLAVVAFLVLTGSAIYASYLATSGLVCFAIVVCEFVSACFSLYMFNEIYSWEDTYHPDADPKSWHDAVKIEEKRQQDAQRRNNAYWLEYAQYDQGAFLFFAHKILDLFRLQLMALLFFTAALIWFTVGGSVFLICFVAPIAAFCGAIKGIYKAALGSGYWFCVSITLPVTAASAWLMGPYLGDSFFFTGVVLLTGVMAMLIAELLRLMIAHGIVAVGRLRAIVAVPLKQRTARVKQGFWSVTQKIFNGPLDELVESKILPVMPFAPAVA